jgi:hypothetical protein
MVTGNHEDDMLVSLRKNYHFPGEETGFIIPDPPRLHSYANGNDPPGSPPSPYTRSSSRPLSSRGNTLVTVQPPLQPSLEEESPATDVAGVDALGRDAAAGSSPVNSVPHVRQPTQNGFTAVLYPFKNALLQTALLNAAARTVQARSQESSPPSTVPRASQARQPATLHGNTAHAIPGLADGSSSPVHGLFAGASPNSNTSSRTAETSPSYTGPDGGAAASAIIGVAEDPITMGIEALEQGDPRIRTTGSIHRARGEDVGNLVSAEQPNGSGRSGAVGRNEGATGLWREASTTLTLQQQVSAAPTPITVPLRDESGSGSQHLSASASSHSSIPPLPAIRKGFYADDDPSEAEDNSNSTHSSMFHDDASVSGLSNAASTVGWTDRPENTVVCVWCCITFRTH